MTPGGMTMREELLAEFDRQAALRRADYDRYKALVDLFIDATVDGPQAENDDASREAPRAD